MTAKHIQQFGRALRSPLWHLERSDPCDEWPSFCWMGIYMPVLTEEDRFYVRLLKSNTNAQYGKLGVRS